MAAVDQTYELTGVEKVTGEAIATLPFAQNQSKNAAAAVWFQDLEPDPTVTPPDLVWDAGALEENFTNPNGTTEIWMAPAGNAPRVRMKIIHPAA